MAGIRAGTLRHRITQKSDTSTSANSVGQHVPTWTTIGTYYALVEQVSADESTNANQLKGNRYYKVTMRNSSTTWRPSDQIIWNGHTLNVKAAVVDPFGVSVIIDASELITQQ